MRQITIRDDTLPTMRVQFEIDPDTRRVDEVRIVESNGTGITADHFRIAQDWAADVVSADAIALAQLPAAGTDLAADEREELEATLVPPRRRSASLARKAQPAKRAGGPRAKKRPADSVIAADLVKAGSQKALVDQYERELGVSRQAANAWIRKLNETSQ
jgi:hypothetical protein